MANKSDSYQIIDEPSPPFKTRMAINPVIILLAAMVVPFIWNPPYLGRWWMPYAWLVLNGYFLGSPTLKKEIMYSVIGVALVLGMIFAAGMLYSSMQQYAFSFSSYVFICMQGVFFLFMYLVVYKQMVPFEIYEYMQEGER